MGLRLTRIHEINHNMEIVMINHGGKTDIIQHMCHMLE